MQAKIVSQVVILALLTQYLLAPKIAESMRQRAIMLCRAFTTTESQGVKVRVSSYSRLVACFAPLKVHKFS